MQGEWATKTAQTQRNLSHTLNVQCINKYFGHVPSLPQALEPKKKIHWTRIRTSWGIREKIEASEVNLKTTMILTISSVN